MKKSSLALSMLRIWPLKQMTRFFQPYLVNIKGFKKLRSTKNNFKEEMRDKWSLTSLKMLQKHDLGFKISQYQKDITYTFSLWKINKFASSIRLSVFGVFGLWLRRKGVVFLVGMSQQKCRTK